MYDQATICAISTPAGQGGIAVVRVSGNQALGLVTSLLDKQFISATRFVPRTVYLSNIFDGEDLLDEVLLVWFEAPNSYTGEDVVEISCHGSVYVQQKILELLINSGARTALPGEFTQRAFLNGKFDLSQSEAVADLIASGTKANHQLAVNQFRGNVSNEIGFLRQKLLDFISLIELELDFSEEDVEFADRSKLSALVVDITAKVNRLITTFRYGNAIKNGIPVAIVGRPNTGKSSLLNVLVNDERAIVSHIPGTTRDTIEDNAVIDGYLFRFVDTAGIRETNDDIEIIGIERARKRIMQSEIVLLVTESSDSENDILTVSSEVTSMMDLNEQQLLVLVNKCDLAVAREYSFPFPFLAVSVKTGYNTDLLKEQLVQMVKGMNSSEKNVIITNLRHVESLQNTRDALMRAQESMLQGLPGDLLAQDVREAIHHLGAITGVIGTDEILGSIFKNFCIGK